MYTVESMNIFVCIEYPEDLLLCNCQHVQYTSQHPAWNSISHNAMHLTSISHEINELLGINHNTNVFLFVLFDPQEHSGMSVFVLVRVIPRTDSLPNRVFDTPGCQLVEKNCELQP